MKVVHINTLDTGGAAIAACRIHQCLSAVGVDSQMRVARKTKNDADMRLLSDLSPTDDYVGRMVGEWNRDIRQYPLRPKGLESFTGPRAAIKLSRLEEIAAADIIHLHWAAGVLDYEDLALACRGKGLVWTLHDMNPFTGGCHYSGTCTGYTRQCGSCPQLGSRDPQDMSHRNWCIKDEALSRCEPVIVTPSRWLGRCAAESGLLKSKPIKVIPNGLPLDVFHPRPEGDLRGRLGIAEQAKVVLFGADAVNNQRKGLAYLIRAMHILAKDNLPASSIVLLVFGEHTRHIQTGLPFKVVATGRIEDPRKLACVYRIADVFVIPSLEDNLPNTAVEAMACGTPVVGFDVGGIGDIVDHLYTGYLAARADVPHLAQGIKWTLDQVDQGTPIQARCRRKAESLFSFEAQAEAYRSVYESVLRRISAPCTADKPSSKTCCPVIEKKDTILKDLALNDALRKTLVQTAQALRRNPNDRDAVFKMAALLQEGGAFEQAAVVLSQLLSAMPGDRDIRQKLTTLGRHARQVGQTTTARDCCLGVLAAEPDDMEALKLWESLADKDTDKQFTVVRPCKPGPYRVGAIVSTYKSGAFMSECLDNLLQQSIADQIQIIVVDAASPENEGLIVARYQERHGNISYIRTRGRVGVYAAWNIAIRHCAAPYCISLSTNDQLAPNACERLADELDVHRDTSLIFGNTYLTRRPHETFVNNTHYGAYQWGQYSYARHRATLHSIGPHPMWRRSVHAAIGFFDERFVADGDQEFWLRLGAQFPIRHIDVFTGLQWITPESLSGKGRTPFLELALIRTLYRHPCKASENGRVPHTGSDPQSHIPEAFDGPSDAATIVIVTYNSARTIADCLKSLIRTLRADDRVCIVDNQSQDDTLDMVRGFCTADSRLRLIANSANLGYAAAANLGAAKAATPFIVFLNPDTAVTPDWLPRLIRHAAPGDVAAVGPVSNCVAGSQKAAYHLPPGFAGHGQIAAVMDALWDANRGQSLDTRLLIGFCLLVKKQPFEQVGGMDANLFLGNDDLDLSWRLVLAGFRLVIAKDTFIFHKGQESFESLPSDRTASLVQESTDYLYYKLVRHYGVGKVPDALSLWGMHWFAPRVVIESDQPLTSIIILTYNQLAVTKQCLTALFAHTRSAFELILVDNGSRDGTVEYLSSLERTQTACIRIKTIFNAANAGFAGGCTMGLAASRGEYLVLLNNDVIVTDQWLPRLRHAFAVNPRLGLAGPMTNYVSGPQRVDNAGYDVQRAEGLECFAAAHAHRYAGRLTPSWRLAGFCLMIRRAVVEKIGGLDQRYKVGNFEDDDFCFRAYLAGFEGAIVNDCFVHHFGGQTFKGNRIDFDERMMTNWALFKEKWNIPADTSLGSEYRIPIPPEGFDAARDRIGLDAVAVNDHNRR